MNTANFVFREPELPEGPNLSGRPQIFDKLNQRDIRPVISLLGEAAFIGSDVLVHDLAVDGEGTEYTANPRNMPVTDLSVIVNRLGRSIKTDQLPAGIVLPPMINENKTRSLAHRKHRAYDEVLKPLGIGIPTVLVSSSEDITTMLESHDAESWIVKPDGGTNSQGIQKLAARSVSQVFADRSDLFGKQVLQPALDFTLQFPPGLRPYDAASREAFEGWNRSGVTKEMRVYGFHSPAETTVFPVGRAINGEDQWFFVDPESVPEGLLRMSAMAIAKAAEVTNARGLFGTVDYGYGSLDNGHSDWHAIELNAKAPYMIGYDKHAGVADTLRELFADQVQAVAA